MFDLFPERYLGELVEIATNCGLTRLESQFNGDRRSAVTALATFGFEELVRLPGYVQAMNAQEHDYILMGLKLIPDEENMGSGD